MKSVYLAASALDAQLIYDQLKDAGFEVFITGLQLSGALGELPLDATPEVKVLKDEQYLPARALVEEILEDRESHHSGTGNCSSCGEIIEQGFQQCWNCGAIYSQQPLESEAVFLEKKGLNIRKATDKDSSAILALIAAVLEEYALKLDMNQIDADLLAIESNYRKNNAILWVVENFNKEIVAVTAVKALNNENAEIRKMYIEKNIRGQGLGRLLLTKAIQWCQQKQFDNIVLETASVLKSAIHLYTNNGFTEIPASSAASRCHRKFRLKLT